MKAPKKREFDKIPSSLKMKILARRHNVQYKRVDQKMMNFLENRFEGNNPIKLKTYSKTKSKKRHLKKIGKENKSGLKHMRRSLTTKNILNQNTTLNRNKVRSNTIYTTKISPPIPAKITPTDQDEEPDCRKHKTQLSITFHQDDALKQGVTTIIIVGGNIITQNIDRYVHT